jgi:hypothetical protein
MRKRRGVKLGGFRAGAKLTARARQAGVKAVQARADARAIDLAPTVRELQAAGKTSLRAIADELNRRGIPTARRGQWQAGSVSQLLARIAKQWLDDAIAHGALIDYAALSRKQREGVDLAKTLRASGMTYGAVADRLNADGYRTTTGARYTASSVYSALLRAIEREQAESIGHINDAKRRVVDL